MFLERSVEDYLYFFIDFTAKVFPPLSQINISAYVPLKVDFLSKTYESKFIFNRVTSK
jgi:hypothetical protein